ncbi:MAG: GTPase HflX, partial [Xanthomonadaceae bacterium]|nr:GTPase HflX [Xanthomonadaceae bacterium]
VWISAEKGLGIDLLLDAIAQFFQKSHVRETIVLPPDEGRLRAELYELDAVVSEAFNEQGMAELEVYLARHKLARLMKQFPSAKKFFALEK